MTLLRTRDPLPAELAHDSRRARQAGFTLLELAVAMLVMMLAVLLACDLLVESGRVLHHSVPRSRDPWALLGAELLRNDLRGGSLQDCTGTGDGLCLTIEGLGLVEWARQRDELVRTVEDGRRYTYLRNVRSFEWGVIPGTRAIDVSVRFRVSSPYLRQLAGSLPRSDPGQDRDLHILVVTRGGGSDEW